MTTTAVTPDVPIQAPPTETRDQINQRSIDVAIRHYATTGLFADLTSFSELQITEMFTNTHRDRLAFLDCGRWATCQSGLWRKETRDGLAANRKVSEYMATVLLPQTYTLITDTRQRAATRIKLQSVKLAGTIAAAARGWLTRRSDEFDQDEYLLGCPGGKAIDLRTGLIRDAQPEDMLMKSVVCVPDSTTRPIKWLKFFDEVTHRDKELQHYLHKMAGSWCTGSTKDHSLAFLYGPGGGGKGTFIRTISHVLHEYATSISIECLLTKKNGDGEMAAIGQMCGCRLVFAQEGSKHRRFNAGLLKTISGGDVLCGRKLYEDPVTFRPTAKMVIASNWKPRVDVDSGIRRRTHIVPFTQNFEDVKNEDLSDELEAESPAILSWLISGCLLWQEEGLTKPPAVLKANADFFEDQDDYQAWFEQKCDDLREADPKAWIATDKVYASWRSYCGSNGIFEGKQSDLVEYLTQAGFRKKKNNTQTQRGISGLALKNPNSPVEVH